ncbi:MAG TPA: DUF2293 domain-containing protein [Blastocatellia bacterium]|nr:DUF2293 domain-containing protein [Blastocatellia bacterium]
MATQLNEIEELKVFISTRESTCGECSENLGSKAWITLAGEKGALCMSCADLDHLIYVPSGDAALTRRAKKHSTLSAVVLRWSASRKRFERQGLLVEEQGLERAEEECLADSEVRARRRNRETVRREELDRKYVEEFAHRVRDLFPGCPGGREVAIAEHACQKYSGRVGRSASAKSLEEAAVRMAVIAHIRHRETDYDRLLARGADRREAREAVERSVSQVLGRWEARG